jgi:hypothetical protein
MHAEKLKEYMRRQPRAASLRPDQMAKLLEAVGQ